MRDIMFVNNKDTYRAKCKAGCCDTCEFRFYCLSSLGVLRIDISDAFSSFEEAYDRKPNADEFRILVTGVMFHNLCAD